MKTSILLAAAATALVSSCGLYNKYERPTTAIDSLDVVRGEATATGDTASFGDTEWRAVFTDPQLQTLIEQGLAKNYDLLNAAQDVKMAEAQLSTARLAFLPSFALAPTGTLSKNLYGDQTVAEIGVPNKWGKTYALPVRASWNADLFGNLVAQNRSAKVALLASRDYQQAVQSAVVCNIATCYYTLLMLDRQLEILTSMSELSKNTWEMMKLQKELRGARETSVVSAEANYLSMQAQAADMRRQIAATENSLSLLIGQPAGTIARGKLEQQQLPDDFALGVPMQVLRQRPDIHAAEMSLAQCFYQQQQARSAFYPALNITATASFTNNLGMAVVNPGKFIASFVGTLTQPLFQNGRLVAGLRVANAQYEKQLNAWQNAVLSAGSEVSSALIEYRSAKEQSDIDRQQVEALTKSVDYTTQLYRMGTATYLEVLTAQTQLCNAQIAAVTDDYNRCAATVSLYSAMGGGRR